MSLHEIDQILDECATICRGAGHVTKGMLSVWVISVIIERPASDGNPGLQPWFLVFQSNKVLVKLEITRVHRCDGKSRGMKEGKGEIEVCETRNVQIGGHSFIAPSRAGPRFVVANCPGCGRAAATGRRLGISACTKVLLAAGVTKLARTSAEAKFGATDV